MAAADKTLQKMRRNPSGWRIDDLMSVADAIGVTWRRPGRGGSHVIFGATGVREVVSVPDKRPIKPFYVMKFVDLMDAFQEHLLSAAKSPAGTGVRKKDLTTSTNTKQANQNESKDRKK